MDEEGVREQGRRRSSQGRSCFAEQRGMRLADSVNQVPQRPMQLLGQVIYVDQIGIALPTI